MEKIPDFRICKHPTGSHLKDSCKIQVTQSNIRRIFLKDYFITINVKMISRLRRRLESKAQSGSKAEHTR
jgi:hypothetical protein